jgi:multicomponent K+:H+ antiporter subunit D
MSDYWLSQLIIVPILLPLISGALLVLFNERHHQLKIAINLLSTLVLLAVAVALFYLTDSNYWTDGVGVYLAANWMAPFGIALIADRLASLMLLLTAVMGTGALLFSFSRWARVGVHFNSLFQFLLMGLNGAFLTGDLFNLFVFFEVMLAASYGLLLHGYNSTRIRAGMQYIVINLLGSFFFLVGVALIYAATGTLNMADIAARLPGLDDAGRQLLQVGATILAIAFLTKSAIWPLCFWLPTSYSAASAPIAAMLVLMTKVGIYALLRLWLLVFSGSAGESAGFGAEILLWAGMATIAFGVIGLFASQEPGRMAGYSAIISSGTLLAAISYAQPSVLSAALFYLLSSTLAVGAFMLLIELIERIRTPGAALLAVTMEAFAIDDEPQESAGVAIPAAMAILGLAFVGCAMVMAGMPPLSGFVAKFTLFHALLNPAGDTSVSLVSWTLMALILFSGLASIIALMRFGVRTFWSSSPALAPHLKINEAAPVLLLLLVGVVMMVQAGPLMTYLDRVAAGLHQPEAYIQRVLTETAVPGPTGVHP